MPVDAANCNSIVCRTVVDTIIDIETGDFSDAQYGKISVTCYYPGMIAHACAGGGDFDRSSLTGQPCRNRADGATVINDNETGDSTQCFERKNFGLNGTVDARQCGVVGDGLPANGVVGDANYHPDDGAVLVNCLNIASGLP